MRLVSCDVCVVGAGPAGSLAAKTAAQSGADTVLLEEHHVPGKPVFCAEGLSLSGIMDAGVEPKVPDVAQQIKAARVFVPNGKYVELTSENWVGYTLNRDFFDRHLAENAVKAGADLMNDTKSLGIFRENGSISGVIAQKDNEQFRINAKVIIGADGYWSITRRSAGLGRWYPDIVSCAQYKLGDIKLDSPDTNEFWMGIKYAPGGYAWVFPKSTDTANIGLGVRKIHTEPAINYLNRFIQSDSRFKDAKILRRNGGVTPVSGIIEKVTDDHLMLIGDAAGELIPMTGAGIHSGTEAGKMAGKEAALAVEEGNFSAKRLEVYRKNFERYWGKRINDSRRVVEMLDKFSDDDLDILSEIITNDEILSLANGQNIKRTIAKIVARSPAKIIRLMKAYLL
jgi:digeranylgeranylglycerophospholipid reductase